MIYSNAFQIPTWDSGPLRSTLKIVLFSRIDSTTIAKLERDHDLKCAFDLSAGVRETMLCDREVLVFRSGVKVSAELLRGAPDLRLIIRAGSGFDNIDVDAARRHGIRIVRIPGPSAQAVSEFAFALLFNVSRKVGLADRLIRAGHWPKPDLAGHLLTDKVLGVVGLGGIGSRVGTLGVALGMRVIGCVRHPEAYEEEALAAKGIELASFERVMTTADYVVVSTQLDESTHHLVDSDALSRMRPGGYLVNVARGGVVDEVALFDSLESDDGLAGAALDVHEEEGEGIVPRLAQLPNVVLTPHIAGSAIESQAEIGRRVLELLDAHGAGTLEETLTPIEIVA
jgi:D-3-phosphoglycerate dehydrogenase